MFSSVSRTAYNALLLDLCQTTTFQLTCDSKYADCAAPHVAAAGADLDVVHVGLHHLQGVLLNQGGHQADALEVGGHLGLHVTQVVV